MFMKPFIDLKTAEMMIDEIVNEAIDKWFYTIKYNENLMEKTKKHMPIIRFKKFGFNYAGKTFFQHVNDSYLTIIIEMNENYLYSADAEKFIKYTTLHELAHAFAYLYDKSIGHNKVWKQIAIALGDDGKRCHDYARPINASVRKPTKRTECICNKCGTKSYLTNIKIKRIKENPYSYTCRCGNYAINFI